ncbi:MAG: transcription antitermination factor NusB [Rhodospirillaceae bacterium]|nr:transcription antitermination factor NusB [Rhodospirillaceae bacterium]|tara:strand:+ start:95 stop:592 length:498 start_codon:yes stop_codon:yes gene_type:complete
MEKEKHSVSNIPISLARLAAVQVLYQLDSSECKLAEAISYVKSNGSFDEETMNKDPHQPELVKQKLQISADHDSLLCLVNKAIGDRQHINHLIYSNLTADWPKERLETIVFSILRIGVAELLGAIQAPYRVTISEYVDIAYAFYDGSEPKLVNAILDKVASVLSN